MLPDFDRADRTGEFWGNPEEDMAARAVVFGLLPEMQRK
jgi:hypothetical protein